VQGDRGSACKLELRAKTQSRALNQGHIYTIFTTLNLYWNMSLVAFSTTLHAPSASLGMSMHEPANGPQMRTQAPRRYAGDPRAMGHAGGGIQGGRLGRPGHSTKWALSQVLARTRFASAEARLLAIMSSR
jgi:hypothetical protein